MRKAVILSLCVLITPAASAQSFGDFLRGVLGNETEEETTSQTSNFDISASDADAGLRQALTIGAQAVGQQLSQYNGYFGDGDIRIPLPGRLGELQSQLSRLGLSGPLDDLQERMNHAAEDAAPYAADLVVDAVSSITMGDALEILNGGDTAATNYLRGRTEADLMVLVEPYMRSALEDSGALTMVDSVAGRYGLQSLSGDLRDQLIDHAVERGLDGLFFYLAKEEQEIRSNPVKRSTDLLRRVFGG